MGPKRAGKDTCVVVTTRDARTRDVRILCLISCVRITIGKGSSPDFSFSRFSSLPAYGPQVSSGESEGLNLSPLTLLQIGQAVKSRASYAPRVGFDSQICIHFAGEQALKVDKTIAK